MPDGPDDPHRHTLVGPAPRASAPDEGRQTVPMERFRPPPSPVADDDQNTVLAKPSGAPPVAWRAQDVTASAGQGAFQPPRPRAPTLQGPGRAPGAPEPFGAALSLQYGGPPPAPPAPTPPPRTHRRALLALAVSTTALAVALFAVSIVLHVKRRPRAASRAEAAPTATAPAVTAAAALAPAPAPRPPVAPTPAPTASPAPPVAAPPAPAAPVAAAEPDDDEAHHHRRRHGRERSPGRHRRHHGADTLLWGAP